MVQVRVRRAAAVGLLLVLPACSGSKSTPQAAPSPSTAMPATPSDSPCPTPSPSSKGRSWPAEVPSDLPKPPGIAITSTQAAQNGVHIVRFTTPTSLRESVLFVIKKLPAAGFAIGRGDAEAREADAPFARGDIRGVLRLLATDTCETTWLLAFISKGMAPTGPLLPSRSPSPSASSLPFG